jgi:hypothetical protein
MFDGLKRYIGVRMAEFRCRKDIDSPQPLGNFFSEARSMLVILPFGYDDSIVAGHALNAIRSRSPRSRLTLLISGIRATPLADPLSSEVIRIDPPDINAFCLPTKSLLNRITQHPYDVAVDLNLDFVLHTPYICRASGARVRVGFARPGMERYYNVQLQLERNRTPLALYEKFAEYLAMF